jgi:hypothetical protein
MINDVFPHVDFHDFTLCDTLIANLATPAPVYLCCVCLEILKAALTSHS